MVVGPSFSAEDTNKLDVGLNNLRGIIIGFGETANAAMQMSTASMLEEEVSATKHTIH
jgi:hypothetical protein